MVMVITQSLYGNIYRSSIVLIDLLDGVGHGGIDKIEVHFGGGGVET